MNLIQHNPYRIAGILANATAREIQSRKAKIQAFARVGKSITSEYDFSFLQPVSRSEESINRAFSHIEHNPDKVRNALFWFVNTNPVDATAIQHLANGNKEKAIEIWEKLTDEKEVNAKNFSAFNNIGTLYLLENSKEKIKQGITTKIKLIESENFKDFVHTVADETFSIDKNKQIEILIDELLAQFKNKYSTAEIIELFNNCNGTTQKYLSKKFTEEPIHKIETQIEKSKNDRSKNKINAYKYATDLYGNTKSEMTLLKSILGIGNLQYKMLADKVAKEILQCSIDYFNESQKQEKSNNYLEEAMQLAKLAETIAVNDTTRNKVKESIKTLEEMKDRELSQAIEVLKSVKEAYEKNLARIVIEVTKQEQSLGYGQSIDWTKVGEAIGNSIDWYKVIELINETIPPRNVEKIKNSDKQSKISEYKSLVDFIFEKLNYSQKSKVKYLRYWETPKTTSSSSSSTSTTTKTTSSSSTSSNDDWILWVLGIAVVLGIIIGATNDGNWIIGGVLGFVIALVLIGWLSD